MELTIALHLISLMFILFFINTKKNIIPKMIVSIVFFLFVIESNANYTNLFVINPKDSISVNQEIKDVFNEYKIELPLLKVHRFKENEVVIKKDMIILPADYVRFNKKDFNLIFVQYIKNKTMKKEDAVIREQVIAEAKLSGKKYLQAVELAKMKSNRSQDDVSKIQRDGGETICSYNIASFKKECFFTTIEVLNLDSATFVSAQEFNYNLEHNFKKIIDQHFSEYALTDIEKTIVFELDTYITMSY